MKKEITIKEYKKKMDRVISKKLSVDETLIEMLNVASKYIIKENNGI